MATFYRCATCGNVVSKLFDLGPELSCCNTKMIRLEPNTVDAATEKHVPKITRNGETVTVEIGDVIHPMEDRHYITFIAIETGGNLYIKTLNPGDAPVMELAAPAGVVAYEYCNLHGLWKGEE
ncbi:desulfoferrodoxin Dfx [Oscillospiraceae bacterium OttesenSCG-928-G22]|nr:desulfoferrodoxin Dfx [Oscillospiraceae bacterium OttesenSCG-928-G22]